MLLAKNRIIVQNAWLYRFLTTTSKNFAIKNESDPISVFDRKAKVLQRERCSRLENVGVYDYIKDEIGYRLSDRVFDIKRKFAVAANIGCSRSYICKHLTPDSVEELIICDTNKIYLDSATVDDGIKLQKRVLDEENIEFDDRSLDLVISSLNFHWINDLPGAFSKIMKALKPDGVLLASVFGGDTLYELRSSLQLADLERRGGLSPHISPFTEVRDIGALMNRAGFTMLTIDTDELVVRYPSMFELMWDLKGMGESNAAWNRSLHLHRDVQFAAAAIYQQLYGKVDTETGETSIPATFQIINMLGWKPHSSQPKPMERGSGEVSLKDLYKIDQIVKEIKHVKTDDSTNK